MKFSIGYNNDIEGFLDLMERYKDHLSSVYFSPPKSIGNSLREEHQDETKHEKDIIRLIRKCDEIGIVSIMLFNAVSEGSKTGSISNMLKKIGYIKKMRIFGLKAISLYNVLYMPFIKKELPDLIVYSSVNCGVKELEMARYHKELGVDVTTIPEEKNRDFVFINDIKEELGMKIQVMLNEGCIRNCPFREIHCNVSSHGGEFDEKGDFNNDGLIPRYHCVSFFVKNPKLIFRSCFIRPEDLGFYEDKVDYFKIVSRDFETSRIEMILNAYLNRKYEGNLFDLVDFPMHPEGFSISYIDNKRLTEKDFFKKIMHCRSDCDSCMICEEFLGDKIHDDKYFRKR